MGRKFLFSISFALMVLVLAGCIRIPIGDGELEISNEGIEFHVDLDENDDSNPQKNDDFELSNDKVADDNTNNDSDNMDVNNDEDLDATNSNHSANSEDPEMMGQGGPGLGICEEDEDHTEFFIYVDFDYWIPPCAEIINIHPYDDSVVGQFKILEGADWEAVTYEYISFLEQEGKLIDDHIEDDVEWEWAELNGMLSNDRKTKVEIQHQVGDYVEFDVTYYHPGK